MAQWKHYWRLEKPARFVTIGFTGHKSPDIHLKMLQTAMDSGFMFDTVQMPLNVMDAHFESFEKKVLPVALKKNIGVVGMKPMGSGRILESDTVTATECLCCAMSLPVSVTITGCQSLKLLRQALVAAMRFSPMTEQELIIETLDIILVKPMKNARTKGLVSICFTESGKFS